MTPGKFMFANGVATLIAVMLFFELDMAGRWLGIGAVVYFWVSLYWYQNWFLWDSNITSMCDYTLNSLRDEWEGRGPFGRHTPMVLRVIRSNDSQKILRSAMRLESIYEELVRRAELTNAIDVTQLNEAKRQWACRVQQLQNK